jgi:hypothetical protein
VMPWRVSRLLPMGTGACAARRRRFRVVALERH